jgi:hypothetical protein
MLRHWTTRRGQPSRLYPYYSEADQCGTYASVVIDGCVVEIRPNHGRIVDDDAVALFAAELEKAMREHPPPETC